MLGSSELSFLKPLHVKGAKLLEKNISSSSLSKSSGLFCGSTFQKKIRDFFFCQYDNNFINQIVMSRTGVVNIFYFGSEQRKLVMETATGGRN